MLKTLVCGVAIAVVLSVLPARSNELVEAYSARLSERDHFNSNGVRLTTVAAIIRQDRANYHRFGIRDPEDQGDQFFSEAENRSRLEYLLTNADESPSGASLIINGTPLVRVEIRRRASNGLLWAKVLARP